jgi:L-lactate dehydrogenase complex protein LldG
MFSRDKILAALLANQFDGEKLPDVSFLEKPANGSIEKFSKVLEGIGGRCFFIHDSQELKAILELHFGSVIRVINTLADLNFMGHEHIISDIDPVSLHDVGLALIKARFAVAENGAVWISDEDFTPRALPFICEHLAVFVDPQHIIPTMHEAYLILEKHKYGYGSFIAGPSKTADIEQSLVIGAHGPRSMTVFVMSANTEIR